MLVSQFPKMSVDAAYGKDLRVKLDGVTDQTVTLAGASDVELGTTEEITLAAGDRVAIMPISMAGARYYVASKAIATDTAVYAAANGKISDTGTLFLGYSMEAASGDGSRIRVFGMAPSATASLVTLTGAEELTNKTLTAPVLYVIDATGGTTGSQYLSLTDNLASAWAIKEGSNTYLTVTTTNSGEKITVAKAVEMAVTLTFTGATGVNKILMQDNLAEGLIIGEGANAYITFVSTNGSEAITVAKATTFSGGVTINNGVTLEIGASTAAAGSSVADAGALPAGTASVYPTTAADDTKGVVINAADKVTGRTLWIGNGVSNKVLKVYAPSGGSINGGSADAAFSSVSGKGVQITCLDSSANTWLAW